MKPYNLHSSTYNNEILYRRFLYQVSAGFGGTLVDLGAGTGEDVWQIDTYGKYDEIICIDRDAQSLLKCVEKGYMAVQADLNGPLPLASNKVDVILANQVIEHIAKTDLMIKEIYRVLKPGGNVLICTPNLACWHNIIALLFGWQPFSTQISDEVYIGNPKHPNDGELIAETQAHLRVFTSKGLVAFLRFHGFQITMQQGIGYQPYIGSKITQLLSKIDKYHAAYIAVLAAKLP